MAIQRGYMGIGTFAGKKVRCTDFNVNIKQEALFYDHTIGLRDSVPQGIRSGKGDSGARNEQKIIWRPSTKIVNGSFSFPWTELSAGTLFEEVKTGSTFDMSFAYTCDNLNRQFNDCKVNSYSIKATQGDIISSSIDIIAKNISTGGSGEVYSQNEKLITWDVVHASLSSISGTMVSFDITINNNCNPIYTSGQNETDLEPKDIRVGMQSLSGSVSYYDTDTLDFVEDATQKTFNLSVESFSAGFSVLVLPMTQQASTSAVIRTFQLVGVSKNIL